MHRHLVLGSLALVLATPALAAPWVRSYVVGAYEPAWHYGGKITYTKGDLVEPGIDCAGGNVPGLDYDQILKTPWRNQADIDAVNRPPNTDGLTIHYLQERAMTFRGFRSDIDTYINPFAAPDPGMPQVTATIAEGFDLDHNARTGGFTSPGGKRGIDNAYYRAWGCMGSFRGIPYHAALSVRSTDKMMEGLYTMVIRVSGNQSPTHDDNATLEIGYSPDHAIKGAGSSNAVGDYSFRIAKSAEYTKLKATVHNGVIETEQVAELHAPKFSWFPANTGDADFHDGRIRLALDKDGSAAGLIGGYRDWRDVYVENIFPQSGATQETREHQNVIAQYYALLRNADGMRDPRTGKNMGISIAYRFKAMPAFVIDPATPVSFHETESERYQKKRFALMKAVFYKAMATKQAQPIPAGSVEGAPELRLRPDGSWTNNSASDAEKGKPVPPTGLLSHGPAAPAARQVRNGAPATVASAAH